ncbi:polysaccharide pyruvyl transferase family protein [Rhizobium sp. YTU87027]|uniref:polysaccharide pyruvyl transferase family protein n=1 Tax=Rhizobium sp. YTU87027 TaxID=3417741 RepID=UPI003D69C50A
MKIGLFGQFGSGNSGNDGSLEAMLNLLRERCPEAELLCICSNPDLVRKKYGILSVGLSGTISGSPRADRLNRILGRVPHRLARIRSLFKQVKVLDLIIIPGTGILDDYQETPWGWPFVIFRWCMAARLRNVPVAFVSIGAGPISHPLSRFFLRTAAQTAKYRSYRDDFSRRYLEKIGMDVAQDFRFPDIAFRLPAPKTARVTEGPHRTVGVGVMHYRGWAKSSRDGNAIYRTYIGKLAEFVIWLAGEGYDIRLLTGDLRDQIAVHDLMKKIKDMDGQSALDHVAVGLGETLHDLMREIEQTDVAIVSRYHNVVCSLKLGRPIVSLGYAQKNDDLLAEFSQDQYCQHIETFDLDMLKLQLHQILANFDDIRKQIADGNDRVQKSLAEQDELLTGRLLAPRNARGKRPSPIGSDSRALG